MDDEVLEFDYRKPNRREDNLHGPGCRCFTCTVNRPRGVRVGVSSRGVGQGKISITIPKIDLPTITFGTSLARPDKPEQKEDGFYMYNGVRHPK